MRRVLNYLLAISFILTIMVTITGIIVHKLASTLFLVLALIHVFLYRKRLDLKYILIIVLTILSFVLGILGLIMVEHPIILILHCGWDPKEIVEDSIVFKQCVSVKDETARFNPSYDESVLETIQCSHVLLSIGQSIISIQGFDVEVNPNGTIKADGTTLQTSVEDVFVGGDVYTGPKFAIDAISHGKEAAESMHRFVHKGHSLTIGRDLHLFNEFDKNNALIDIDFDHAKRQIPGIKKGLGEKSFRDLRSTFTEEQVKIEANRCLGCGASIVDTNKCIGCGLCTTKCEFDAIHLTRDIKDGARMVKAEDKMKAILPYAAKRQIKIIRNKKK